MMSLLPYFFIGEKYKVVAVNVFTKTNLSGEKDIQKRPKKDASRVYLFSTPRANDVNFSQRLSNRWTTILEMSQRIIS